MNSLLLPPYNPWHRLCRSCAAATSPVPVHLRYKIQHFPDAPEVTVIMFGVRRAQPEPLQQKIVPVEFLHVALPGQVGLPLVHPVIHEEEVNIRVKHLALQVACSFVPICLLEVIEGVEKPLRADRGGAA
jgi:hypothetical protein